MVLPALPLVLGFVVGQRLGELWLARRNTLRLQEEGAFEVGASHYPLFILLHGGWILAIAATIKWTTPPNVILLAVFLVFQLGRIWVIASLGRFWTTRIITLPGTELVKTGPFKYVRHPNYIIVAGEIAVLPLAFGAWEIAAMFSLMNMILVLHRIRIEEEVLRDRG